MKESNIPHESHQVQEIHGRYPDEILKQSFVLKNPFRESLRLGKVSHSCGCIDSDLGMKEIPPAACGAIDLTVRLPRRPGISGGQTIIVGETVKTKRPYRYLLTTRVQSADVIRLSDSGPFIQLGELRLNELPIEKRLAIEKGDHPLEWDTLVCQSGSELVVTDLMERGPGKWDLQLLVKDVNIVGSIRTYLEFSFLKDGQPRRYKLVRPLFAEVVGPVLALPSSVFFGVVPQGEKVERVIHILGRDNQFEPVEVLAAETKHHDKNITMLVRPGLPREVSLVFEGMEETTGSREGLVVIKVNVNGTVYDLGVRYAVHVLQRDVDPGPTEANQ